MPHLTEIGSGTWAEDTLSLESKDIPAGTNRFYAAITEHGTNNIFEEGFDSVTIRVE